MKATGTWRGQPLAAMVLVIAAWIAVRIVMWQAEVGSSVRAPTEPRDPPRAAAVSGSIKPEPDTRVEAGSAGDPRLRIADEGGAMASIAPRTAPPRPFMLIIVRSPGTSAARASWPDPAPAPPKALPLPAQPASAALPPPTGSASTPMRRWSADGWLLARQGGGTGLGGGAAPATYGASQTGAVLRYRLSPGDPRRPAAYARATAALDGSREQDLALGLSARPLAVLPAIVAAELRATRQPGGTRLRPALMLISELPAIALPAGLRAEVYAQAGYVGGRFATAFADGQLRMDGVVTRIGKSELRAGVGGWGGAQKGVSRVDLGPGAILALPLGKDVSARLALDWRLRVAGNAAPASGPTLTLSAGF